MSVSVRARPTPGKYMVDVYFKWPDGSPCRDRKVDAFRSEASARKWGEQRESELRDAGKPRPEDQKPKVMKVAAFAPEWMTKHHEANLHKRSGIDTTEMILRCHLLPFIGNKHLDEISDDVVADLRAKWTKGGYQPEGCKRVISGTTSRKTHNNRLSVLSSMLHTAVKWSRLTGLLAMPCTIELLPVDDQREPAFYDHETYERLAEAAREVDARVYAAVLLAGDGGCRRGEIIGLDLADIAFKREQFTPKRSVYWKRGIRYVDEVKGVDAKPVPTTPRLLEALKAIRHLRGPRVLLSDEGAELTPKMIKLWVMRAEAKAGLPQTGRLHVYRHTFCSHLAMAGVPAMTIKELARHKSLAVTMRYMHLSPSAKDEGIAMLAQSRAEGGKIVHGNALATDRASR
jgi:integrase